MDRFIVGKSDAILISASASEQKKIVNASGGAMHYKNEPDVDTEDTELANGASVTTEEPLWIISASETWVHVTQLSAPTYQDLSVTDDLTVTDKLTAKGEVEIDGALNHDGEKVGFLGTAPAAVQKGKPKAEVSAEELCEALEAYGLYEEE